MIIRALKASGTRHGVFRQTYAAARATLMNESFPNVMRMCFPQVPYEILKHDSIVRFPNGSSVLFGGLDSRERTEKILGHEFATIYINEASQVSYESRNMLLTRLAQKSSLDLKEYIDANPPGTGHWLYLLFEKLIDPVEKGLVQSPTLYQTMTLNPVENRCNIPESYFDQLESLPERERRRFLLGEYSSQDAEMLWSVESIVRAEAGDARSIRRQMRYVVVAVDPSGVSGPRDMNSDEVGIIVVAVDFENKFHVLEDVSRRDTPAGWAQVVMRAVTRWSANAVVAEKNFGGAMVESNLRGAGISVPIKLVSASKGKAIRAEPVAAAYERKQVVHHNVFHELEDQMMNFSCSGYLGSGSPDRVDALVWGLTELLRLGASGNAVNWASSPLSFER